MNWKEKILLCAMCGMVLVLSIWIAAMSVGIVERLIFIWAAYR